MATEAIDIIDLLPGELAARLLADEYFVDINVLVFEQGNIAEIQAVQQGSFKPKAGKLGVCVVIPQIVADDDYPNLAAGPMTLKPAVQVIECVPLNQGQTGTGKSARVVARRVRDCLKPGVMEGLIEGFSTEKNCILPILLADALKKLNLIAYQVNFTCFEKDLSATINSVAIPTHTDNGDGTISLACVTASAAIWYTTDESYPSPDNQNPQAIQYTGPITVEAGDILRAAAYLTGYLPSGTARFEVS